MDNNHISFPVPLVRMNTDVGAPLLLVTTSTDSGAPWIGAYARFQGELFECRRFGWVPGMLDQHRLMEITATIEDKLYTVVASHIGVQQAIDLAP